MRFSSDVNDLPTGDSILFDQEGRIQRYVQWWDEYQLPKQILNEHSRVK
jgi:hypothetical protein